MNTENVFKYKDKFYKLNQRFIATIKPTMSWAWEEYKKLWRNTYSDPAKWVSSAFRDSFREVKDMMRKQKFYVKWTWYLWSRNANTCELRVVAPIYWILENLKLWAIWLQSKWAYSSEMFDMEPIDLFPREWWELTEWEKYDLENIYWTKMWWNADIFKAIWWPEFIKWETPSVIPPYNMYWSWKPYWDYETGYTFINWTPVKWYREPENTVSSSP